MKSQSNTSPRIDQGQKTRVVIVAGLAGGTGSGMFLDFAAHLDAATPTEPDRPDEPDHPQPDQEDPCEPS